MAKVIVPNNILSSASVKGSATSAATVFGSNTTLDLTGEFLYEDGCCGFNRNVYYGYENSTVSLVGSNVVRYIKINVTGELYSRFFALTLSGIPKQISNTSTSTALTVRVIFTDSEGSITLRDLSIPKSSSVSTTSGSYQLNDTYYIDLVKRTFVTASSGRTSDIFKAIVPVNSVGWIYEDTAHTLNPNTGTASITLNLPGSSYYSGYDIKMPKYLGIGKTIEWDFFTGGSVNIVTTNVIITANVDVNKCRFLKLTLSNCPGFNNTGSSTKWFYYYLKVGTSTITLDKLMVGPGLHSTTGYSGVFYIDLKTNQMLTDETIHKAIDEF